MKQTFKIIFLITLSFFVLYFIANFLTDKFFVKKAYNGCIDCHGEMIGFVPAHSPEVVGCEECHLGNSATSNKDFAHKGMILIPGNLSIAAQTCGTNNCHPGIAERVNNSLMNTMSGIISVNKFVFGEADSVSGLYNVKNLGHSAADSHLRNLCASCHLSNEKIHYGPVDELTRGGGCNACHLNYNNETIKQLNHYETSKNNSEQKLILPKIHPQLSLNISDDHCFGCHSRSGRISTNYQGWFETLLDKSEVSDDSSYRILMDDRVFEKGLADIHFEMGLSCIDCHISVEIMGDGNLYAHKEQQVKIQCEDCHFVKAERSKPYDELDPESKKIVDLRNLKIDGAKFLLTEKGNYPLINTFLQSGEEPFLLTKVEKKKLPLKKPLPVCISEKGHKNVSCISCHTSNVSHCVTCHTEYSPNEEGFDLLDNVDTKYRWDEYLGNFFLEYPTLGISELAGRDKVETFIPGMIFTIDKGIKEKNPSRRNLFKRLYAQTFSHTIRKEIRSCESCHNNPLAIGYGREELTFSNIGKWFFKPKMILRKEDNLPEDAWIPFLKNYHKLSTTRPYTRPFNLDEQKRILTVGACLTCHKTDSAVMKDALKNFETVLQNLSSKCISPVWN